MIPTTGQLAKVSKGNRMSDESYSNGFILACELALGNLKKVEAGELTLPQAMAVLKAHIDAEKKKSANSSK